MQRDPVVPRVVPDLLRHSARLVPDRIAVACGPVELTFAELDARANAFAAGLRARGVRRGDRIALVFSGAHWPDFVVAYFGTLQLGAAALLLGDRFSAGDVRGVAARHRVAGVVAATELIPAEPELGCWIADAATVVKGHDTHPVPIDAEPSDAADVVFTSGTTAEPRGIVATHANVVRAQPNWPTGPRANQPGLHALPLGSVAGQIHLVNSVGGQHTLVLLPAFDVAELGRRVEQYGVLSVFLVPAMAHWLVRTPAGDRPVLPGVRGVHFSGAPLPVGVLPDLPAVFPNAAFYNFYSSTEAFPARVATRFDPDRPDSVGRPAGTHQVRITAPDRPDVPLPAGEVGAVWLRSAAAPARRFLQQEDEHGEGAGFRDGWTRTGDLGHLDADGYLYLDGRTADIVNVGGFNVSTFRVEEALRAHEAVADAAVCPVDHPVLGEVVAAFVVLRADATVRELRQHAAGRLSRRELPAIVRCVEDLPRNPAGKVVKSQLPALLDNPGPASFVAARTPVERAVAEVWADVLDLGSVGVDDNFFELGGDSLTAVEAAAQLRSRHGLTVDAVTILELTSLSDLADHLAAHLASEGTS